MLQTLFKTIATNADFKNTIWKSFLKRWFVISAMILFVTAIFSEDIYHADEYFQTIEFTNYKLGNINSDMLPQEFRDQIRPWLQPYIYLLITKASYKFGIYSPFTITFFFRLFSAFWAWVMIALCCMMTPQFYICLDQRRFTVYLLNLIGILPYMLVRTSSDALSTSFSMIGFALLFLGSIPKSCTPLERSYSNQLLFCVGLIWGVAFEIRFATAFLLIGFLLWFVFSGIKTLKKTMKQLLVFFVGICLPIFLSTLLDSYAYGNWCFAPWNFIVQFKNANIDATRSSYIFDTLPFWGYFKLVFSSEHTIYSFINPILFYSSIVGIIRQPKNVLSWITTVYIIFISLIPHKELRFLMLIIIPACFLTTFAISPSNNTNNFFNKIWNWRKSWGAWFIYIANFFFLIMYVNGPNKDYFPINKFIYNNVPSNSIVFLIHCQPYYTNYYLRTHFYQPKNVSFIDQDSIPSIKKISQPIFFVTFTDQQDSLNSEEQKVELLFSYQKTNLYSLFRKLLGKKNFKVWRLYKLKLKKSSEASEDFFNTVKRRKTKLLPY
ncbi:MAG: hypothetical protein DI598_16900, partial [Pseudopedobacter saltans]